MVRRIVRKVIEVCDRCIPGKEKPFTEERIYALENRYYKIKLCDEHAAMFDRDMSKWTMLSEEVENPYSDAAVRQKSAFFTEERKREARRVNELTDRVRREAAQREFAERRAAEIEAQRLAAEIDRVRHAIPGALKFRLTDHARERMVQRGFSPEDVFMCVAHPTHMTPQPWRSPTMAVAYRDDCRVVVDTANGGIVTVIDRGAKVDDAPDALPTPRQSKPLERTAQ